MLFKRSERDASGETRIVGFFDRPFASIVTMTTMSRMFGLLSPTKLVATGSSTSLSELDRVAALKEALDGLDALLNDDLRSLSP